MPEIVGVDGPQAPAQPQAARQPLPAPARVSLGFMRTELGNQQVRRRQTVLPLHIARLLLLFEGPQTVADLRQMIDESWLPEALIELERRRLIQRVTPVMAPSQNLLANAMQVRHAAAGDAALGQRRGRTRLIFLRQLGSLGTDMARRIDQCRSDQELDELMPQVDALIEAIAGHEALGYFHQHTTRSS